MTQLTLFIELLEIIKELLEADLTTYNVRHAHRLTDLTFDKFEEMDGLKLTDINDISIKLSNIPTELKSYFKLIELSQHENDDDLPSFNNTIEVVQFSLRFLTILCDLLQAGVTPCHAFESRLLLEDLFKDFAEQVEEAEALEKSEEFVPPCHLFPDLETMLNGVKLSHIGV
jgi:hypothetical protein